MVLAAVYLPTMNILRQGRKRVIECAVEVTPSTSNLTSIFKVIKPTGSFVSESTQTNSFGLAIVKFRLKGNDPAGIYHGQVEVKVNGLSLYEEASVVV